LVPTEVILKQAMAIAAGHQATAAAALTVMEQGGSAFDGALAGMAAACVAEPVLATFGGGGFLLARPADGEARLYDFFVSTPRQRRPEEEIDFYPVECDFGTAKQVFHIGLGSIATPGAVAGLFAVHEDLGRLPMTVILEPAVRLARDGLTRRPIDRQIDAVVQPILEAHPELRALIAPRFAEQVWPQPALADTIEALGREGARLFYEGDLAEALVRLCRESGGQLQLSDLHDYRVERRQPLECSYRDLKLLTNPPPSSGGILIAFALALLAEEGLNEVPFGSQRHLSALGAAMTATNKARIESGLATAEGPTEEREAARRLLDPELLRRYRGPGAANGTTRDHPP
jgi:gamma-glutamyltranspeptidase/glutathione hydrolase